MNLILLASDEAPIGTFARSDPRGEHIRHILKSSPGDDLLAGIVGGKIGRLKIETIEPDGAVGYSFLSTMDPPPQTPQTLLIGAVRPPVSGRLLRDLTTIGVSEIAFCSCDLSESSYLQSKIWSRAESYLRRGAEQGRTTLLPRLSLYPSLDRALAEVPPSSLCFSLDNEAERSSALFDHKPIRREQPIWIAVGPERGGSTRERAVMKEAGWRSRNLRVRRPLRTENAAITAAVYMAGVLAEPFRIGS